jgi:hypothetical protein
LSFQQLSQASRIGYCQSLAFPAPPVDLDVVKGSQSQHKGTLRWLQMEADIGGERNGDESISEVVGDSERGMERVIAGTQRTSMGNAATDIERKSWPLSLVVVGGEEGEGSTRIEASFPANCVNHPEHARSPVVDEYRMISR